MNQFMLKLVSQGNKIRKVDRQLFLEFFVLLHSVCSPGRRSEVEKYL